MKFQVSNLLESITGFLFKYSKYFFQCTIVTRRMLLQVRDLKLDQAIDICRASEDAGRQLKAMASSEEVQAAKESKQQQQQRRGQRRHRSQSTRRERQAEQSCK